MNAPADCVFVSVAPLGYCTNCRGVVLTVEVLHLL